MRTGDTVLLTMPSPPLGWKGCPWAAGVPGRDIVARRTQNPPPVGTGERSAEGTPFSPVSDAQAERPCAAEARRGPSGIGEHLGGRGAAP